MVFERPNILYKRLAAEHVVLRSAVTVLREMSSLLVPYVALIAVTFDEITMQFCS